MEWSFGILPLVKLFRKLKRIKEYRTYIYVPEGSSLYYMLVLPKTENKVIQVYQFPWDIVVQNRTGNEYGLELDTAILDVLLSITFTEASEIGVDIYRAIAQDETDISYIARVGEETLSIQAGLSEELVQLFRDSVVSTLELQESSLGIALKELANIVDVISDSPYDITKLAIVDNYVYFINDLATRVLRLPLANQITSHYIDNPFDMYCLFSGLFLYNPVYIAESNVIRFEYGLSKTSCQVCYGYFYPEVTPIVEIPQHSYSFDNFLPTHKVSVSKEYLKKLKKQADEGTSEDNISFLTFDKDTRIFIRDIGWLLSYKRDIDLNYQSTYCMCLFNIPPATQALFTLYSQLEN